MTKAVKNHPASMRARLDQVAKAENRPFAEVLQFYAMERFLYRLSRLKEGASFVLKGGIMFRVWDASVPRPTRDIDLLGNLPADGAEVTKIIAAACRISFAEDGMVFDADSITTTTIKEDADYEGIRVTFRGLLGTARTPLQIDIGFGDIVVPQPVEIEYPVVLEFPPPTLRAYTRESVIAEKFHAMVLLGSVNSRMKDFYDVWFLSQRFDFAGAILSEAIAKTFARRKTALEASPVAFESRFSKDAQKHRQWDAFRRKGQLTAPESFEDVVTAVKKFLEPMIQALKDGQKFDATWQSKLRRWSGP